MSGEVWQPWATIRRSLVSMKKSPSLVHSAAKFSKHTTQRMLPLPGVRKDAVMLPFLKCRLTLPATSPTTILRALPFVAKSRPDIASGELPFRWT